MSNFGTKYQQVYCTLQRRTEANVQSQPLQTAITCSFIGLLTSIILIFSSTNISAQIPSPPTTPQPSTFSPVIINPTNRTATSIPDNTTKTLNIYQQDLQKQKDKQKELDLITQEIQRYNQETTRTTQPTRRYDYSQYQQELATYNNALQQLKSILKNNPSNPSLADAFYITEGAYGNPYLTRKEYDNILNQSADFIKKWMKQNNYDLNNNDDIHLAIEKFMSEQLTVTETLKSKDGKTFFKTSSHQPFFYEYDDYQAQNDHRNFFVTKCLATGGGQCNSLPMVYLLLAEKLNVPTYLSFAPQHSFIRYQKNNGEIDNYEPTSNWHINNLWYEEHLFISADAIRSGIYLDTLNKQKIVANCMLDLAIQYIRKMPDDGKFIQDCLWESHFYFPENNNIYAYFIYSDLLKDWLSAYIARHNITDLKQIKNDTMAYAIQKEYQKNEGYIKELGYRDLPEGMYNEMIEESEMKDSVQKQNHINGKTKHNLFTAAK